MRVNQGCRECMLKRERERTEDPACLAAVDEILSKEENLLSTPYLAWLFSESYYRITGIREDYAGVKKKYNDLVLSMRGELRARIEAAEDPFRRALEYARIGNYIDFGALKQVEEEIFLSLFEKSAFREDELTICEAFRKECAGAKTFLLVADNCGEIILDMLFLEQLKKVNPAVAITVFVRGGMTSNDVTAEDADYVGLPALARILPGPYAAPGLVVEHLEKEARETFLHADVVLSKGQGNYEGISGCARPVYFLFLCKCDVFADRFRVPKLTGMFIRESGGRRDL